MGQRPYCLGPGPAWKRKGSALRQEGGARQGATAAALASGGTGAKQDVLGFDRGAVLGRAHRLEGQSQGVEGPLPSLPPGDTLLRVSAGSQILLLRIPIIPEAAWGRPQPPVTVKRGVQGQRGSLEILPLALLTLSSVGPISCSLGKLLSPMVSPA